MSDKNLVARVKVTIHNSKAEGYHAPAFGAGVVRLCELVDKMGSLNKAAKEMDMAYSKAWRIIKSAEEILECELLERKGPKGSCLTAEGKRFVGMYRCVEKAARKASDEALKNYLQNHH